MPRQPTLRGKKAKQREANLKKLYAAYRRRAKNHGREFQLTLERFRELTKSNCLICGAPPGQRYKHDKVSGTPYVYNGIDRIDNGQGYIEGNCAPCCSKCNYAKGTLSLEEFLLYIYRAYHHSVRPALQEGTPEDVEVED